VQPYCTLATALNGAWIRGSLFLSCPERAGTVEHVMSQPV